MEMMPRLQLSEFEKALTPQRIRVFQIISMALLAGPTLFLGIVLFLYSTTEPVEVMPENSVLPLLSIVHVCMALIHYIAIFFVSRYFSSPKGLKVLLRNIQESEGGMVESVEGRCIGSIFTTYIIRAAILEGLTLFGLIICLLGTMEGEINLQPLYWGNLFSYILFAAVTVWTFPTKDRLETHIKERFLQNDFRM